MRETVTNVAIALEETMSPSGGKPYRDDGSAHGSVYWRDLGDGREITVFLLTFGRARMGVGQLGSQCTTAFY